MMINTSHNKFKNTVFEFPFHKVSCYFDFSFSKLDNFFPKDQAIIITDTHLSDLYKDLFKGYRIITFPPGDQSKQQTTVSRVIEELLTYDADKHTFIVGVGGGVVTDIAGYVSSIYKRGLPLILVPTSLLGMVDAALGGKNGINAGIYKNMVGTIYQPEAIFFDFNFLDTLPRVEWINGFAEIIKHACIRDPALFTTLEASSMDAIISDRKQVADLVEQNVHIKMEIVLKDEREKSDRQLLNFGHTIGHAIENIHQISHGQAISIGMVSACALSERFNALDSADTCRIKELLAKYHLRLKIETDPGEVFSILKKDKKRINGDMNFVLLNKIGSAVAKRISLDNIEKNLQNIL